MLALPEMTRIQHYEVRRRGRRVAFRKDYKTYFSELNELESDEDELDDSKLSDANDISMPEEDVALSALGGISRPGPLEIFTITLKV